MKNILSIPAYTGLAIMLLGIAFIAFVAIDHWLASSADTGFEWITPLLYLIAGAIVAAGSVLATIAGLLGKPHNFHRYLMFMGILYLVVYCAILYFLWNRSIDSGAVANDAENLIVWSILFIIPAVVSISGSRLIKRSGSYDDGLR